MKGLLLAGPLLFPTFFFAMPKSKVLAGEFNYKVYPFIKYREGTIEMEASSDRYGDCYFYVFLKLGPRKQDWVLMDSVHRSDSPRNGRYSVSLRVTPIAYYFVEKMSLFFGVMQMNPEDFVDYGSTSAPGVFVDRTFPIYEEPGSDFLGVAEEGQEVETPYTYTVNSDTWSTAKTLPLTYSFFSLNPKGEENRRTIPYQKIEGRLYDPYKLFRGRLYGNAELRLIDHLEDFALARESGLPYIRFPLVVAPPVYEGDFLSFHFVASNMTWYSKKDLTMVRGGIRESFSSKDIFLPLRKRHDKETYHYQIVLTDFGPFETERIVIPGSISYDYRLFGPASGSAFHVALGEDE